MSPPPEAIANILVKIGFRLFDLVATRTEDLARHPELRSVLAALKHSRDEYLEEEVLRLILSGLRYGTELDKQVITYMLIVSRLTKERLKVALRATRPAKEENQMASYAQELLDRGWEQGSEEGRAKGIEEGRIEGRAEMLIGLLAAGLAPFPTRCKRVLTTQLLQNRMHGSTRLSMRSPTMKYCRQIARVDVHTAV